METKQGSQAKSTDTSQLTLPTIPKVKRVGHGVRGSRTWDKTMVKARGQADNYARGIAREDGWPPFIIVCDVGYVFEIYADFSGQGHGYTQYPDGNNFRIFLEDLEKPEIQDLFRAIWNDPQSLDTSKQSAKVTREISDQLALLGNSFEIQGHEPEKVAGFLMRCLFSMFAEDVDLIPKDSFSDLLKDMASNPDNAAPALQSLWETMDKGGFSPVLRTDLLKFNGGLFAQADALPLDSQQIALLIGAANKDWKTVEPAIFGTLLERALDKRQRHKLGAHYTPRAYVERLVMPTVIEPLRNDWEDVQTSALLLADQGKMKAARDLVHTFHRKLCATRVLDPACGSGNFLYVALELMKRLEGEITTLLDELGEEQTALGLAGHTVDPHQFLGIELNPWAAKVAELVLWIGYLQWHFRTHGQATPAEPVLRDFHNIENRDAVLDYASTSPRMSDGTPVTRWDGITTKTHPVTGEEVPDETARVQVMDYAKPRAAKWPEAEFIVGNPPFIGSSRMRDALGDGYAEALWAAYPKMPKSADFVMFWWEKAALKTRAWMPKTGKGTRRFGFITTNSLRQTLNRRVLEPHLSDPKKPLSLIYAIPDHPWVDAAMGAAVRIAMTVGRKGRINGKLRTVVEEVKGETENEGRVVRFEEVEGRIFGNLRIGADVVGAKALKANQGLSARGAFLIGKGFLGTKLALRELAKGTNAEEAGIIRPFLGGYDLTQRHRQRWVIDFWGLSEKLARRSYPLLFQHVLDTVKPIRNENPMAWRRENWWVFGDPSRSYRSAIKGLSKVIVTSRTAKFSNFQMWGTTDLPESEVIVISISEFMLIPVLSSKMHRIWCLATGGTLEDRPRYNNSLCFDPFPFPSPTDMQKTTLRALGEELDKHRKDRQAKHPKLTLTNMYNVLEKLRSGDTIEGKDKEIYQQGLVGLLKDIHDRIDAAVAKAYGWPNDLSDEETLQRLVDLNHERTKEEAQGKIRWLRPEYQNPSGKDATVKGEQAEMGLGAKDTTVKPAWPKTMPEQVAAVRDALAELGKATPEQLARTFKRGRAANVAPLLESMAVMGSVSKSGDETYRPMR
ncbi:MAG: class I SAM-dependent DNA methyltransferase [Amylibacter sp.]|nr:class I SAM-dependent DNA methyltransferase [Amylibacter sp.]